MAEEPYTRNRYRHIGKRYEAWTVIGVAGRNKAGKTLYHCRCDCGSERDMRLANVLGGQSQSCGCRRSELLSAQRTINKNRPSLMPEYQVWFRMKQRCSVPTHPRFHDYGGRGIEVCEQWRNNFAAFYRDMGPRPTPKHTLERKDNDAGYCPENCAWATRKEQNNNRRSNVFVIFNGERMTLMQAIERSGLPKDTVYMRRHLGWPQEFWFIPIITNRRRPTNLTPTKSD